MSNHDPNDSTQQFNSTQPLSPARDSRVRQRVRRRSARNHPLFLPLWSIALMLLTVIAVLVAIVLLVFVIGGNTAPESDPIILVITSPPTDAPPATATLDVTATTNVVNGTAIALPQFVLEGPTLPPVYLSPTPDAVAVGRQVEVINVGENGLNVRAAPGIDSALLFTARENTVLEILAGPESAQNDSFTWWQIRDVFTGETGWAVDLYMEVQPEIAEITNP